MNKCSLVVVVSMLLVACTQEVEQPEPSTGPLVFLTEQPGGTCGEQPPVTDDLSTVCADFGGVEYINYDGDAVEITCKAPHIGWMRFDRETGTGVFEVVSDECTSSYSLERR